MACKVLQLLQEGGLCEEKTFLGSYSNPHAASWADIVKRYESGSVFLVELAQSLVQNCSYELPAIKKEMARAQKELHELGVAEVGGEHQRREAVRHAVGRISVRPRLEQHRDALDALAHAGDVERREAALLGLIGARVCCEQLPGRHHIAALACHVERRRA